MTISHRVSIGDVTTEPEAWNPRTESPDSEFRYIDIGSIDSVAKTIRRTEAISVADAPSRARQIVCCDDVLVSTVRPNLNAVAIVPPELHGAIASTGFAVLRPKGDRISPRYLFHWVRTPAFVRQLTDRATGASYPAVTEKTVRSCQAPLPTLGDQQRIVQVLDSAEAIERRQRVRLSLLRGLLFSAFDATAANARTEVTLGSVADIQSGLQVTASRSALTRQVPYLRVANVYADRLDLTEVKPLKVTDSEVARAHVQRGDLLIVEGHGNRAEVGRCAVWDGSIDPIVHQNHLIRARMVSEDVVPEYVSAFLNSPRGRAQILRLSKTTSGLNTISANNVRSIRIVLPPLEGQRHFAKVRDAILRYQTRVVDAVTEARNLFDAISAKMLQG